MPPDPAPPTALAAPPLRPRLAGALFLLGGLLLLISLCLPWLSITPRPGIDCPACSNGPTVPPGLALVAAAWVTIRHPGSYGIFPFLGLLFLVALPLAYIFFGARLVARPVLVRGRWKVLAILGCILLLLAILITMLVLGLGYVDAVAVEVSSEIGESLAWWPPIILFAASLILPACWRATNSVSSDAQPHT